MFGKTLEKGLVLDREFGTAQRAPQTFACRYTLQLDGSGDNSNLRAQPAQLGKETPLWHQQS
jgi:hypothetical protein